MTNLNAMRDIEVSTLVPPFESRVLKMLEEYTDRPFDYTAG
jgi:hypothetical protein